MKVKVLARTVLELSSETDDYVIKEIGYKPHELDPQPDELAEAAGRLCYESWGRPNPNTATNEGYLANIIDHQHFTVLEHSSITFHVSDVTRAMTHEFVRHRLHSFSQVSQRYVDHSNVPVARHPSFDDEDFNALEALQRMAQLLYECKVDKDRAAGKTIKEARGAARLFLTEGTSTSLVVTGNLSTWRQFFQKRATEHADIEIREVAKEMLRLALAIAPNSLQDLRGLLDA